VNRLLALALATLVALPAVARAEDDPEGPAPLSGVD